jgi:hypothetical protein
VSIPKIRPIMRLWELSFNNCYLKGSIERRNSKISISVRNHRTAHILPEEALFLEGIHCRYGDPMVTLWKIQTGGAPWKFLKVSIVGRSITNSIQKKHPKNLPVHPFQLFRPIRRTRPRLRNPWWCPLLSDSDQSGDQATHQKDPILPTNLILQLCHSKPWS